MTEISDVITVDQFLPHPPSTVWRALTDPAALTAWFMRTDFRPEVGHEFTFTRNKANCELKFGERIACTVLAVDPERLLRFSWTEEDFPGEFDTVVTWTLRTEGRGTRIFVEHKGFSSDEVQQLGRALMADGWPVYLGDRLGPYLRDARQAV